MTVTGFDECAFESCPDRKFRQGQKVVQMAQGRSYRGNITPTYERNDIVSEWHVECFREFPIQRQRMPYRCQVCDAEIQHGQMIYYAYIGERPAPGYVRPENRGDELVLVRCAPDCARG